MKMNKLIFVIIAAVMFQTGASWSAETAKKSGSEASIDVRMELTARLLKFPGSPSFTAKGKGELHYTLQAESAVIKGESIPRLVFEAPSPPEGLKKLTVIAEG
ncbi:MAG: hypothetical protein V2A66_02495, partial [Pseudomonadota bacterium]